MKIQKKSKRDPYKFTNLIEYESVIEKVYLENDLAYEGGYGKGVRGMQTVSLSEHEQILLKCLDENKALWSLIAFKCAAHPSGTDDISKSATNLIAIILSSLAAIYNLTAAGLTATSLQICRPLRETTNALVLCRMNDEFAMEFAKTTDPKTANEFWHRRIARNKDVKAIEAAVAQQDVASTLLSGFQKGIDEILGAAVHPSQIVASIARTDDLHALLGIKSRAALGGIPLIFALSQCFKMYICLFEKSIVETRPITDLVPTSDQKTVLSMHQALLELYLFTITRMKNVQSH